MSGQYSVENTKKLLDFVFVVGVAVKASGADGKYDLADLGQLMPVFVAASQDFKDVGMVPKELGELDEADALELVAYAQSKLPGVVDKASLIKKINDGLRVALALVTFLADFRKEDTLAPVHPIAQG